MSFFLTNVIMQKKKTKCLERERGFGENLSVFLASNEERVKEKHKGKISLCLWVTSQ